MLAYSTARPFTIRYLDSACVVVDKPAGLLSVPGKAPYPNLSEEVQAYFPEALVVHRLDQATSGLILFARGAEMARAFGLMFQQRRINKHYQALVAGDPDVDSGLIDLPLMADWPNRPRQKVCFVDGKPSQTYFSRLGFVSQYSATRLALEPITGRTHQLRLHLASLGHPILGDTLYGNAQAKAPRLMLHARRLAFDHPLNHNAIVIESPVPF